MKAVLFFSLLALAALPTCRPDAAKIAATAARNPAAPAAVRAQLAVLRDSADASWRRMITSDDQKISNMRALLRDLGQSPAATRPAALAALRQATRRLPGQRYDRQSMASSPLIDRYDAAQDSVLHQLLPLAAPGGNAPTARIRDYVEAIQAADNDVVRYRARYDGAAKAYNTYLQLHQAELAPLGGAEARAQPLPLFEVSP